MWYEMIPAAILSGGLLYIPILVIPIYNKWAYGSPHYRKFDSWFARHMLIRDERLKDGNFHKQSCLEGIPDS